MVDNEKRKRTIDFMVPVVIYGIEQVYFSAISIYFSYYFNLLNDLIFDDSEKEKYIYQDPDEM